MRLKSMVRNELIKLTALNPHRWQADEVETELSLLVNINVNEKSLHSSGEFAFKAGYKA